MNREGLGEEIVGCRGHSSLWSEHGLRDNHTTLEMSSEAKDFQGHEMQIKDPWSMYSSTKIRTGKQTPGRCSLLRVKCVHNSFEPKKLCVDTGGASGLQVRSSQERLLG